MKTGLVLDPLFKKHQTTEEILECPARLEALERALETTGLSRQCERIPLGTVTHEQLEKAHSKAYLERFEHACRSGAPYIDSPECPLQHHTWDIASTAAGSVLGAVDRVLDGGLRNAFCAIRPPGHHVIKGQAMGFCYLNNVAIAAHHLLERGLERILIFDWDVHHGNGTQDIFYEDPRVLFCSTHGHPATLWPFSGAAEETGRGAGRGFTVNVPLTPGSGDNELRAYLDERFLPRAHEFVPQFVLVSAGFDAHRDDPYGNLSFTESTYGWLTEMICGIADEHCGGRVVSVLEGGYNLVALARSATTHVRTLVELAEHGGC